MAKTCPSCGSPIFQSPDDDELADVLASLDAELTADAASSPLPMPSGLDADDVSAAPSPDYIEQIQDVRAAIAAQSTALQELADLSWENPTAASIRDELTAALTQLHDLRPPVALAEAHDDFVQGAEHLVHGFVALVDAISTGEDDRVDAAQDEITQATERFRLGAEALNSYLSSTGAGLEGLDLSGDDDLPDLTGLPEIGGESTATEERPGFELPELPDDLFPADETADAAAARSLDELDLPEIPDDLFAADEPDSVTLEGLDLPEPPEAVSDEMAGDEADALTLDFDDEIPPLPPELEDMDDLALSDAVPPPAPSFLGGNPPLPPAPAAPTVSAAAWSALGDPATDSLLLEIEAGWVRGRPSVYDAIERTIRAAVADALRNAMATRAHIEEEARATLQRIAGERNRLLDEVESLRGEATGLQAEVASLRRGLNELERSRQIAQERRQHMIQEVETHRSQLLGEIESLVGQLDTMRRDVVALLNMSAQAEASARGATAAMRAPSPIPAAFSAIAAEPDEAFGGAANPDDGNGPPR